MEPKLSGRSSNSSHSSSFDFQISPAGHNSPVFDFRTRQNLASVLNNPDTSFFDSIYDSITSSLSPIPTESSIIPEITSTDFKEYFNKVNSSIQELYSKENIQLKSFLDECTPRNCYENIASDFFQEKFDLSSQMGDTSNTRQEDLSELLDMTDLAIFYKISDRWQEFMNAAREMQHLDGDINQSIQNVQEILKSTNQLKNAFLYKALKTLHLKRRMNRIQELQEYLKLLVAVKQTQPTVQELLNTGHFSNAVDIIAKSQDILNDRLRGVVCIRNEMIQLEGVKEFVDKMLEEEFMTLVQKILITSVYEHLDKLLKSVKADESQEKLKSLFSKPYAEIRLGELIENKLKVESLHNTLASLAGILLGFIIQNNKNLFSQLGVHKTDESVSKWTNISHHHLLIVLKSLLVLFSAVLGRVEYISVQIIKKLGASNDGKFKLLKSQFLKSLNPEASAKKEIISDLEYIANCVSGHFFSRFSKIFKARKDTFNSLSLEEINDMYSIVQGICDDWTQFSDQAKISLQTEFYHYEKNYLQLFHNKKIIEVNAMLENEIWDKIEIPDSFKTIIMDRRTEVAGWKIIRLEPIDFSLVASMLQFYKMIYEYVKLCTGLRVARESTMRLVEIVKTFVLRVYDLIVGAKLVEFGKVKSINTRHLGLGAQCLCFIIQELRYIQIRLEIKLPDLSDFISTEFQKLLSDIQSLSNEFFSKIISVITPRIEERCRNSMNSVNWEMMLTPQQLPKDYYTKLIMKDLHGMYTVLCSVLNNDQIRHIFSTVLDILSQNLLQVYCSISISSSITVQRIKNDIESFTLTLRELLGGLMSDQLSEFEIRFEVLKKEKLDIIM